MKISATSPLWANIFMLSILIFSIIVSVFVLPGIFLMHYFITGNELVMPAWAGLILSQAGIIGIPCAVYLIIQRKNIREILPMRRLGWENWLFIIGLSLAIYPVGNFINVITSMIFGSPIDATINEVMETGGIWMMLALFPILPSIFEEVALRGIVFTGYRKVKIFAAAMVNGLFFGILHQNFNQFSYAFLLGVFMCYFIYYTKSIWAPVLSHVVINATAVLLMGVFTLIGGGEMAAYDPYMPMPSDSTIMLIGLLFWGFLAIVGAGIFVALYIPFRNHNLRRNQLEGVITDEHAAAVAEGERTPSAFGISFWVVIIVGFLIMAILQILMWMVG
ncbi:MAG: CPBP family intramembrane metalloprotease [Defluviitaleaceae bacterium]|nr:CPBP family intramembrane metalloprotease [Defluviitaleaceae bacterium]